MQVDLKGMRFDDFQRLTFHHVRTRVLMADGTVPAAGEDVALVNNIGSSLFRQMDLNLNDKQATSGNPTYAMREFIRILAGGEMYYVEGGRME